MIWFKNVGSMIVIIFLMTIFSEPTLELILTIY